MVEQLKNGKFVVACDHCEDEWVCPVIVPDEKQARIEARAVGWTLVRHEGADYDYCPECQPVTQPRV